jgi:Tfp pilus assembly protein PilO
VDNINYKFTELPSIHSISYEITFPVTGKYLDIRKFLSQISQKNSGVVLQNVEVSRENNQVNELDGVLQLAIYARN